jgi:DNA repair protein RecN (Recombination protein N)
LLLELRVKNLGIIEDMNWRLHSGLNVITGETGAGKSLIIDAVELLLSGKASPETIRYATEEARIEGVFTIPQKENMPSLCNLLEEKGLADNEDKLIIDCEIRRRGPGVIRVNGHAISKTLLRQIGLMLVDIHGQSEHLSLLDKKAHLDFLDAYADTLELRNTFTEKASALNKVELHLRELDKDQQERARREEFLKFQLEEISRANLKEEEDKELEREKNILASAEKLKAISFEVYRALSEDEETGRSTPALEALNSAFEGMKKMVEVDATLKKQMDYLGETIYGVAEVARDLRAYGDNIEDDPGRLEEIESRLELIRELKRKYGATMPEILSYQTKIKGELDKVTLSLESKSQLEEDRARLRQEMGKIAQRLSRERVKSAKRLKQEVKKELNDLNMSQVQFDVSIKQQSAPDGLPFAEGESYSFNANGVDDVEFMVSTNPGEPFKPLAKIASTGELSRFSLALKGALAESDSIPVLIFDEIDIGVGGRSGEIIGKKLSALARNRQVVCVTHLPQIAVFADAHFSVHKETSHNRTISILEPLEGDARIEEIAVMLSGHTAISVKNSRELMSQAEKWKNTQGREE